MHFKNLGFQGALLLLKRNFKVFSSFNIMLPGYNFPVILRNNSSDVTVFYQVFLEKSYKIKVNKEPKVIIDCGANIGLSVVYFKNRFPNSKIIAIEPETSNFQLLKDNTKMYKDVYCLNSGIWYKSTNLKIKNKDLGNWGFTVQEVNYEDSTTIKAISINQIMLKYDLKYIDILKIDIEGSEKELFQEDFEYWLSKTGLLIIELHDGLNYGASKSFFKAISNYDFYMLKKNENLIFYFN